jgi:hypothetical protein
MERGTLPANSGAPLAEIRTVREAAEYLRVPSRCIYTHLVQLPHFRVDKYARFRQTDLEQAVAALMRKPQTG